MAQKNSRRNRRSRKQKQKQNGGLSELLKDALVPLTLLGLNSHLGKSRKRSSTKKGMFRKTARRAYMKNRGGSRRRH